MPDSTDRKKPTLGGLLREATAEFSGFDHGVPYTIKCLLTAPGATVRRHLDDNDPRITRPWRLFIVALALALAASSIGLVNEANSGYMQELIGNESTSAKSFLEFFSRYQTALNALVLPLMMLATRAAWPRAGRTLAEHLVLNTYLFSVQLLIVAPFTLASVGLNSERFGSIVAALTGFVAPVLMIGYAAWMMATFFEGSRVWSAIRAIAIQLGMLLPYWLIVMAAFLLWNKLTGTGAG